MKKIQVAFASLGLVLAVGLGASAHPLREPTPNSAVDDTTSGVLLTDENDVDDDDVDEDADAEDEDEDDEDDDDEDQDEDEDEDDEDEDDEEDDD